MAWFVNKFDPKSHSPNTSRAHTTFREWRYAEVKAATCRLKGTSQSSFPPSSPPLCRARPGPPPHHPLCQVHDVTTSAAFPLKQGTAAFIDKLHTRLGPLGSSSSLGAGVVEYFGTRINRNRFRNILGYFGTIPIYPPPSGRIFRNRQDISEPPPSLCDTQNLTLHNR